MNITPRIYINDAAAPEAVCTTAPVRTPAEYRFPVPGHRTGRGGVPDV